MGGRGSNTLSFQCLWVPVPSLRGLGRWRQGVFPTPIFSGRMGVHGDVRAPLPLRAGGSRLQRSRLAELCASCPPKSQLCPQLFLYPDRCLYGRNGGPGPAGRGSRARGAVLP